MSDNQKEQGQVTIGEFVLTENCYADRHWLNKTDGEGMALSDDHLKELETLLEEFYKKHF